MKALLIKSLPCTNTLPYRLKVTIQGQKPFIISQDSEQFDFNSIDCIALQAAKLALVKWDMQRVLGLNYLSIGQLHNNDFVITLINKNKLFK